MRNHTGKLGVAIAALLATSLAAATVQDQAPKGNLVQQLQAVYVPTVMDGIAVTQPGATLAVKKEGIQAYPARLGYYGNDYEDGQVTAGSFSSARDRVKILPPGPWRRKIDSRALAVDEKVYLLKMEVNSASIDLYIQSCGTCDPAAADFAHHPYRARVSVHFVRGFLNGTDLSHVQQAIGEILAMSGANSGQNAQAQQPEAPTPPAPAPAPAPTQFSPIAPPEAPPSEPVQIALGQTIDQVVAASGSPVKTVKLGLKEIYVYKDLKVTFVNGKVANVE